MWTHTGHGVYGLLPMSLDWLGAWIWNPRAERMQCLQDARANLVTIDRRNPPDSYSWLIQFCVLAGLSIKGESVCRVDSISVSHFAWDTKLPLSSCRPLVYLGHSWISLLRRSFCVFLWRRWICCFARRWMTQGSFVHLTSSTWRSSTLKVRPPWTFVHLKFRPPWLFVRPPIMGR